MIVNSAKEFRTSLFIVKICKRKPVNSLFISELTGLWLVVPLGLEPRTP